MWIYISLPWVTSILSSLSLSLLHLSSSSRWLKPFQKRYLPNSTLLRFKSAIKICPLKKYIVAHIFASGCYGLFLCDTKVLYIAHPIEIAGV